MKQQMNVVRFFTNIVLISGVVLMTITACKRPDDSPSSGDWKQIYSSFGGTARSAATSFQIGDSVYVGLGVDGNGNKVNDFWAYTISGGYWDQLGRLKGNTAADTLAAKLSAFPGVARFGSVGFSIGGKGYVGLGYSTQFLNDFYQFDPKLNTWKKLSNFPGLARRYAVAFSLNGLAYVGTGYGGNPGSTSGNYLNDFWSYNPSTDTWKQVRDFGGTKREGAISFILNNKAYVGFGNNNGLVKSQKNIYEFDPTSNTWTEKTTLRDTDGIAARGWPVAFAIGNSAFMGMGTQGGGSLSDWWEWEPTADVWTERTSIADKCLVGLSYSIGFSNGKDNGYITTGLSGSRTDIFLNFIPSKSKSDCDDN